MAVNGQYKNTELRLKLYIHSSWQYMHTCIPGKDWTSLFYSPLPCPFLSSYKLYLGVGLLRCNTGLYASLDSLSVTN